MDHRNPDLGMQVFNDLMALGKKCTSRSPKDRPEMVLVLQELENLEERRDIVSRAQNNLYSPTPCPSNPLEIQMLYDALSQQRRASVGMESPVNVSRDF